MTDPLIRGPETDGRRSSETRELYDRWQAAVQDAEGAASVGDWRGVTRAAREAAALRQQLGGNPTEPWWYTP